MLHFLLQFLDYCVVSSVDLVSLELDHDLLSSICEFKCRDGLFRALEQTGNSSDERGLRVASQTVLEQSCNLRVSVRNMCFLLALGQ